MYPAPPTTSAFTSSPAPREAREGSWRDRAGHGIDAAVHAQETVQSRAVDRFAHRGDPGLGPFEERLSASPRLHRHDQRHVHFGQRVEKRRKCCAGLDREPGAEPARPDRAERLHGIGNRLEVHDQVVRPGVRERVEEAQGLHDHEVDVERERGQAAHRPDQNRTKRNVRHELAVHDVHVEEVGAGARDGRDLVAQPREIRGEDRGTDSVAPRARPDAHGCW